MKVLSKIIALWLIITLLLCSSLTIYADEQVYGDFFIKHVVVNGEEITNYNLQYPYFLYQDRLYMPLTKQICEINGVEPEMNWDSRTLVLTKIEPMRENITDNWMKRSNDDFLVTVVSDCKVIASKGMETETLDLDGMPVLCKDKTLFIPLSLFKTSKIFSWELYYNSYYGTCVSSDGQASAESYCDKAEARRNEGICDYIRSSNSTISKTSAQKLTFLFLHASKLYDIDEVLLLALAKKESHYNVYALSRGGATGVMQIMPATAAGYGLTQEDLFTAERNIEMGAMYIADKIDYYDGNKVKALSAYNQGIGAVKSGNYSTGFANSVLSTYNTINNHLKAYQ